MSTVRVSAFSISLDGYGAGPNQDIDNPLGVRGTELHQWVFETAFFHRMVGREGGLDNADNRIAENAMANIGAWILGRNMFGPVRGEWPDDSWKGWWGANPPYHCPVYVLTHFARPPLVMEGGTTFYFVTDGIQSALQQAKKAAGEKDVRIGGGVATIRQYLTAGLIDEMHLAVAPVLLGTGEHLFNGINLHALGFRCADKVATDRATHVFLKR
jgi:dihydrofolate reductase